MFDGPGAQNKETAIYVPWTGEFRGQYVAACATEECSFLGEHILVLLARYMI